MGLRKRIRGAIETPEGKRRFVQDLFGRIAVRYDLTNDLMSLGLHRRWKRQVLELAGLERDHAVLDLAAGTGDLALGAAGRVSSVVAADLTAGMLEVGRAREGGDRVRWTRCDALKLPFTDRSFDRILIGYGLRNFPDLDRALSEIRRCLRPGGRLVTLDFGKPRRRWLRRAYLRYLDVTTAIAGWLLHRDPEAYLYIPESLRTYPDQRGVNDRMLRAGFERCGWIDLLFGTMAIHFGRRAAEPSPRASPRE